MLTGLGSKYHILQTFQKQALVGENCMIVNGFNPSFSLSEFVNLLCDQLFGFNREGMRQDVLVGILFHFHIQLSEVLQRCSLLQSHVFILIHSFDGPSLRSSRVLEYLR